MQKNNIKSVEISETFGKLKICELMTICVIMMTGASSSAAIFFMFFTFTLQYIIRQGLAFLNMLIINVLKARKKIFILNGLQLLDYQREFLALTRFEKNSDIYFLVQSLTRTRVYNRLIININFDKKNNSCQKVTQLIDNQYDFFCLTRTCLVTCW